MAASVAAVAAAVALLVDALEELDVEELDDTGGELGGVAVPELGGVGVSGGANTLICSIRARNKAAGVISVGWIASASAGVSTA